ncbi:tRNA dihydrouridine synthase DusB [Peptostreptococcus equinus]|uniref:tRNA-dihydrouridine synthase n=1 Tax=Peptostreptococcus equinus TaxID=3003601 RepID=A0ABY7JTG0_9FIRM|nr:tRNA dihydrouridine synthase DusB [Peptostreptococcus sp. CBA3647]WAW15007.1 tRNA dihydrouridine synthase DusB [Peptostreptococcus sp. CBA3647]
MKFRDFEVKNEVFLAPMAGVTDLPFRLICKEHGCGLLYTEMINAKALCYNDENTKKMLNIADEELPVAVQIFGSEPEYMARATEILNEYPNEVLDINMGCPAPKVIKNGDGSALMKNPEQIKRILDKVLEKSKKSVTIKIRKGWDENSVNAIEIAKIAQEAGVDAITIHGRTKEQYYSGKADWDIIEQIKSEIKIPVIGNGDVVTIGDAIAIKEKTKCDAIMIGRGAQGNPWIFETINAYIQKGIILDPPSKEEKINVAIKHLKMAIKEHGEYVAIREMRKHIGWYLKGMKHSARFRDEINHLTSETEVIKALEECAKA